jgi:YVTN family beta-propeller protein
VAPSRRMQAQALPEPAGVSLDLRRLVESVIGAAHDERVTAPSAPARSSARLVFRLAVIVASVVAAIVGSVLLVTQRSSEKVNRRTGAILAPALPAGGKVVARIRIGRAIWALGKKGGGPLAVGEGAVWAMSDEKATLMRIDPSQNAVVARIKVGIPEAAAAGDGAVWLSYPSENTVKRVDPATNTVAATIPVGPQPEGIAVSPGAVWVANAGGPSVSRIDPVTNRIVTTIRVGLKGDCCAEHTSVIASPRAVWVALTNGKSIVHVDPATNSVVATTRVGYRPCGLLAADETGVWWTGGCGGDVVGRVDSRTNWLTTNLGEVTPVGIEVAFGSVWVANAAYVDQIDPHSRRLVARLPVVGLPVRLGIGFGSVWVNDDYGRVLRIKPQR